MEGKGNGEKSLQVLPKKDSSKPPCRKEGILADSKEGK